MAVLERAFKAGVGSIVTIGSGYGLKSAERALDISRRLPSRLFPTVGLHPHDARLANDDFLHQLVYLAAQPGVVAIGETGLDFHYDLSPRDDQRRVFRFQINLACRMGLPLVIHDRESNGEVMAILEEEGVFTRVRVVFHCFSGDIHAMERLIRLGAYISIPGIVTWSNAKMTREVARSVPLERLLVETDSPFLAPEPWRGRRNEPAHILYTIAAIAALKQLPLNDFATAVTKNAARFFAIPLPD